MKQTLKNIFNSYIETNGIVKLWITIIFGLFTALITVIEPLIFIQIIKKIEDFYTSGVFHMKDFIYMIIFWGIFIIFSILISYVYRYYLISHTCIKNYLSLSSKYAKKVTNMSYPDYLNKKVGSIYKIFDRGAESQFMFLFAFFLDLVKNVGGIVIILIILFTIDYKMAFITLSMMPIMIFFGYMFYKKLFPLQREVDEKWNNVYGDIGNIMSNFSLIKTLTLEKIFTKKIDIKLDNCYKKQIKIDKGWSISDIYTSAFVMISRILVLGFGAYYVVNGNISFTTLFLFFSYIGWVYFPLGFIFGKLRNIQEQLTAIEKFYGEFDNLEKDLDESGKKIRKITGEIEYKNVSFSYDSKNNILNKLSFKIKQGKITALVGNTGAGKSTIINLLLRLWDNTSGKILLDGKDILNINKTSLRGHIGVVSQDNSLFNLSIKENLLFANPKATKKEIEDSLKKAEANFVFEFENGLDTIIGERGLKLSGGEKQRLSIARLFLKNPEILILDEATSALDNKTEKLVHRALEKLMKGRTSIIIAHRLSTIQNADNILVLERGQIVESGNHKELMKNKGKFYNLANPDNLIIN